MDEVIIRYADTLSAEAISFKLKGALTPVQVKRRLDELLTVPDRLTAIQQDQLVTQKMRILVARMEELPLSARNAEVLLRGLVEVGNRLDKREAVNDRDLNKFYGFEGVVLFEAVVASVSHLRNALGELVSAIPEAEWDRAMERSLRFGQLEIAKYEATDADATTDFTDITDITTDTGTDALLVIPTTSSSTAIEPAPRVSGAGGVKGAKRAE